MIHEEDYDNLFDAVKFFIISFTGNPDYEPDTQGQLIRDLNNLKDAINEQSELLADGSILKIERGNSHEVTI